MPINLFCNIYWNRHGVIMVIFFLRFSHRIHELPFSQAVGRQMLSVHSFHYLSMSGWILQCNDFHWLVMKINLLMAHLSLSPDISQEFTTIVHQWISILFAVGVLSSTLFSPSQLQLSLLTCPSQPSITLASTHLSVLFYICS